MTIEIGATIARVAGKRVWEKAVLHKIGNNEKILPSLFILYEPFVRRIGNLPYLSLIQNRSIKVAIELLVTILTTVAMQ